MKAIHLCVQEEEKPPPLPIKKRNSIPTDGDISVVDRPGFLPLYMDDRARMQMGLTGHDSVSGWHVKYDRLYDFSWSRVLTWSHVLLSKRNIPATLACN